MMIDPITVLEHITCVAPCGVRFQDEVTGQIIHDGLDVTAYATASALPRVQSIDQRGVLSMLAPRQQAFLNNQGIYVLKNLPGLRETVERGQGDAAYWANVAASACSFTIEVVDRQRRFLPCTFPAQLPARNLLALHCGSGSSAISAVMPAVSLFSASTRQVPSTIAVIRAELWDLTNDVPASWAIIEAYIAGHLPIRGMADFSGKVALFCPYPEPVNGLLSSPLQARSTKLIDQSWQVQLHASYTHLDPVPLFPDLCTTLDLPLASLWGNFKSKRLLSEVTLKFGQELFVSSEDALKSAKLLITPAASPS